MVPMTAGCVVLAYKLPGFQGDLKLSRKAYAGIFLGEIKHWNDPLIAQANRGVKLPNLTIATVVRQDGSGTTFAFTKNLDAISEKWRSQFGPATLVNWPGNAMRGKGNEGVAGLIGKSDGAIGYVGYEPRVFHLATPVYRQTGVRCAHLACCFFAIQSQNISRNFPAPKDKHYE